jgi:hypothetical protein
MSHNWWVRILPVTKGILTHLTSSCSLRPQRPSIIISLIGIVKPEARPVDRRWTSPRRTYSCQTIEKSSRQRIMMEVEQPQATTTLERGGAASLTPEASRLFRVYKTVSSLLSKRGYMVSREMREVTPASFTQKFGEYPSRDGLTILVVREFIFLQMVENNTLSFDV